MSKIIRVKARQVYDSRGNPTVEAEVFTSNSSATAICPSGASTGTYEAFEKRDKNNKKYLGKSVLTAVNLVNTKISNKLRGYSVHNQERIDALMINLDGTKQKSKLGASAFLTPAPSTFIFPLLFTVVFVIYGWGSYNSLQK